ncbi:MAG: GGDEF domain-containing protein [Acidimicrobiia bacterium]|nr:GGDEF domain-containing protein [Acidimicrobiia bacterium]
MAEPTERARPDAARPPVDAAALEALLAHIDEALLGIAADGTVTWASPGVRRVLGHDPRALVGQSILDYLHPDDRHDAASSLVRWSGRSGAPRGESHQVLDANGEWIEVSYDASTGPEVAPFGDVVLTLRPADAVDRSERELRARDVAEARLVRLATVFLTRPPSEFELALNAAMEELAGLEWITRLSVWRLDGEHMARCAVWEAPVQYPTVPLPERVRVERSIVLRRIAALAEVHIRSVRHLPDEWGAERELLLEAGVRSMLAVPMVEAGQCSGMLMAEVTLAEIAFGATHLSTLRSAAGVLGAAFARAEAARRLEHLEQTDRLTGIPNRVAFDTALRRALVSVEAGADIGVAVGIVDLDRFKVVNDALGHVAGDRLLADVAARLAESAPEGVLLARLGGDELLVVASGVADAGASRQLMELLLEPLRHPFEVGGRPFVLTASAGVAHTGSAEIDGVELLRRADVAMYQAKAEGGARVVGADDTLAEPLARQLRRASEIRTAVETEAIDVWFQAEWDLVEGRVLGAEALARWPHPTEGLLEAAAFLPTVEETGQIVRMGEQVLRKALWSLGRWLDAGLDREFVLRVNVSAHQLRGSGSSGLVALVAEALDDAGVPGTMLCLELTESALLTDPDHAVSVLGELRTLGVGLAVDDFGTGYSSMLYLKRLPISWLKVDRAFVAGLPDDAGDTAIVRATVQLSAALGLGVTAEGLERPEQRDALVDLGCTRAQGFHLSRPEPDEQLAGRLGLDLAGADPPHAASVPRPSAIRGFA